MSSGNKISVGMDKGLLAWCLPGHFMYPHKKFTTPVLFKKSQVEFNIACQHQQRVTNMISYKSQTAA